MTATELRCDNRILHGVLENRVLEVKCRSARCGARRGVVIIHRFSVVTGGLLETLQFKDPITRKVGEQDGSRGNVSAVRAP
jgi:hypothetical protein